MENKPGNQRLHRSKIQPWDFCLLFNAFANPSPRHSASAQDVQKSILPDRAVRDLFSIFDRQIGLRGHDAITATSRSGAPTAAPP